MIKILGEQFGVEFLARGENDKHIVVQLLSEDDEIWHKMGNPFSSFWIDDLIAVINQAKIYLEGKPKDPSGFGRKFG